MYDFRGEVLGYMHFCGGLSMKQASALIHFSRGLLATMHPTTRIQGESTNNLTQLLGFNLFNRNRLGRTPPNCLIILY